MISSGGTIPPLEKLNFMRIIYLGGTWELEKGTINL